MTLRGILTAQLPLQARWTCEARLARSFAASVLARIPLAATSAVTCLFPKNYQAKQW